MKYLRQFLLIMMISFMGEILSQLIPLPIPASVYGLIIMLICLLSRIIQVEQVEETGEWLIMIMPILFIPSAVSLMNVGEALFEDIIGIGLIVFVGTVTVMVVTGKIAQYLIRKKENEDE